MKAGGLIKWTVGVHSSADPSPSVIVLHHSLTPTEQDDITKGLKSKKGLHKAADFSVVESLHYSAQNTP